MSVLEAVDTQFKLSEDGGIFYQPQASNPLPGEQIGFVVKGESILKPAVSLIDATIVSGVDKSALQERVSVWLKGHVASVLEPLVALGDVPADEPAPVKGIAFQVYESLGIVPRENLETLIADLDNEMRTLLRAKKIRLGPILVFIPALNKPAAVRLRALLWGLWNDQDLPMDVPKDGVVSFEVDAKSVNRDYYQSIAYPVFGSRAIRIDMLDRVISAIYDSAQGGKFRAQHKMAEWLGSTIDGLYDVLKAMGHNKIEGSAASEQPVQDSDDTADVVTADDLKAAETKTDNDKEVEAAQPEEAAKEVAEATKDKVANEQVKPDLAEFYLKKGKAFQRSGGGKKNFKKNGGKDFKSKGKKPYKKSHNNKEQHRPRVISTGPEKKLEDSPFAILEQLKNSKNE